MPLKWDSYYTCLKGKVGGEGRTAPGTEQALCGGEASPAGQRLLGHQTPAECTGTLFLPATAPAGPTAARLPLTSAPLRPAPPPQFWMLILATTIPIPAGYFMPIFIFGESGS